MILSRVSGEVYAAGVISGRVGGSDPSDGEPGGNGRQCSPTKLFEPIAYGLGPDTTGRCLLVTAP